MMRALSLVGALALHVIIWATAAVRVACWIAALACVVATIPIAVPFLAACYGAIFCGAAEREFEIAASDLEEKCA